MFPFRWYIPFILILIFFRRLILELEERYSDTEQKRRQREGQLKNEIETKENRIAEHEKTLKELECHYGDSKQQSDDNIKAMVEHFLDQRTAETARLKVKMKEIIQSEHQNSTKRDIVKEKIDMKRIWNSEMEKICDQERAVSDLQNEVHEIVNIAENQSSVSDEDKIGFERDKAELEQKLNQAQEALEESYRHKEKSLSAYVSDYRKRFDLLCWEREKEEHKIRNKKDYLRKEIDRQMNTLEETVDVLADKKEKYQHLVTVEEESLRVYKKSIDDGQVKLKAKCEEMQGRLDNVVRSSQETDQSVHVKIEEERAKLDSLNLDVGRSTIELNKHTVDDQSAVKSRMEETRIEISEVESKLKLLEEERTSTRLESEEVVQETLHALNMLNVEFEQEVKLTNKQYSDREQTSREKILLHQESVDDAEKQLLQCRNNLERNEERLQELRKLDEGVNAKADNELLFTAFLLEKDLQENNKTEQYDTINNCKANVENIANKYKDEVSRLQKEVDEQLKPLVLQREKSQVVLEDLVRSRGISEVAMNELTEQFELERSDQLANIERLREKLADLEEEASLSKSLGRDVVVGCSDLLNVNRILEKERAR